MNTKIEDIVVERNPYNYGYYCFFEKDGQEYYADLAYLKFVGIECMIFKSSNQQVTDWSEEYCNRSCDFTENGLIECVKEFMEENNADTV